MKICVIGNSHVASLRQAWDEMARRLPDTSLTFFAAHGRLVGGFAAKPNHLGNKKLLVPDDPALGQSILFTSGGSDCISFDEFDICVLHGLLKFPRYEQRVSAAVRKLVLKRLVVGSLAAELAQKVRACSDIPVWISPQPLQSTRPGECALEVENYAPYQDVLADIGAAFPVKNVRFLAQPDTTRQNRISTAQAYSTGSVRLDRGKGRPDRPHRQEDFVHMNAAYGVQLLESLFDTIQDGSKANSKPRLKNAEKFQQAKMLEASANWSDAERGFADIIKSTAGGKLHFQARRRRAECLMRLQRWDTAKIEIDAVHQAGIPLTNQDLKRRISVLSQRKEFEQASSLILHHTKKWIATDPDIPQGKFVLLIAAAPKTGGTLLSAALAAAAGWARTDFLFYQNPSLAQGFPSLPALDRLKGYGVVNHSYLSPNQKLMAELAQRPWVKVALHFRHPVETVTATLDMIARQNAPMILSRVPHLATASMGEVTEWMLSAYVVQLVEWMNKWLALVDERHPSILYLTTFDQMVSQGQDALARRVLRAGAIPQSSDIGGTEPRLTEQDTIGDCNIVLTASQQDQILDMFPSSILQRFDWH